jgi:hypothetical protein
VNKVFQLTRTLLLLPKHDPVAIHCRDHDLPHAVWSVGRWRAGSAARDELGMKRIDIVDIQIAEQVVGTDFGGSLIARTA